MTQPGTQLETFKEEPARVLVIEDDRMSQMLLQRNLKQAGYEVSVASDGPSGLAILRAGDFDLVITDFVLPGMDGYEILTEIANDERTKDIPVVVVSGVDDTANATVLVEAGAADYLTKPINTGLLRARVGRCIEAKRMRTRSQRLYTQLEDNYTRLRELERMRDGLTHMIIHDLRTPLTSMLSGLKLVTASNVLSAHEQHDVLDLVLASGESLAGMINDLLEIHRLQEHAVELMRVPTDLGELAEQALTKVRGLANEAAVTIEVQTDPELGSVKVDAPKMDRVMVNLLGNALKASPRQGHIKVALAAEPQAAKIAVTDHGHGIPSADLPHIFERFYQVANRRSATPSSGLGLSFCKLVVEAHGGQIWAESQEGAGSSFFITIPN